MNKREAAIISAYTGVLIGKFDDLHKYIEEIMGRPVFTHELAEEEIFNKIKEFSKDDFMNIKIE
jgi:hypothetical protein